jgi:hypothetical protein
MFLDGGKLIAIRCSQTSAEYSGYANFLVIDTYDTSDCIPPEQAVEMFGPPVTEYELCVRLLLVWDHDITPYVGVP